MPKQKDVFFYCFIIAILTLRENYPDNTEFQVISKLKTWFIRDSCEMKAIYFLEDHSYGSRLTLEGIVGTDKVLEVLKIFCDNQKILSPPDKEYSMFPSEMK